MSEAPKRGLGRGLSALLGDELVASVEGGSGSAATEVPIERLVSGKYQPRTDFDAEALQDLAASIREKGILQPILVRKASEVETDERYEIIAGERRWRAAQIARLHTVPVLIRACSDQEALEVALIENLQRRDLGALEEAEGYRRLQEEFSHSQEDLARTVGKSRSHIANTMRLLGLPEPVKTLMTNGALSAGHARALLNVAEPTALAQLVVKKGLNVRQTEKLATEQGGVKARKVKEIHEKDADTLALERDLEALLGLKVHIEFQGRGGRVVLHYDSLEQLDDILYRLNSPTDNRADQRRRREDNERENKDGDPVPEAFGVNLGD